MDALSKLLISIAAAVSAAALSDAAWAATRYVDAIRGANASNCTSAAAPCKTISYAMSLAVGGSPGDTVLVAPGRYDPQLGEVFPITMVSGIQLKSSHGAEGTLIDATGSNKRVLQSSGGNASTLIQGFTIMGGLHAPAIADGLIAAGGALSLTGGDMTTVSRNIFYANEARGYDATASFPTGGEAGGGAIHVASGSVRIENNVLRSNIARGGRGKDNLGSMTSGGNGGDASGGAIHALGGSIVNNTLDGNYGIGGYGGWSYGQAGNGGRVFGSAVFSNGADFINNVVANNGAISGFGGVGVPDGASGATSSGALLLSNATSANNLFHGNNCCDSVLFEGTNLMFADPIFHFDATNLRIAVTSPARARGIAAGTSIDFRGLLRPAPPSIGAFEPGGSDMQRSDFDADRKGDLLWRNSSTGQVYRITMDGFARVAEAMVYQEANTAWKIIADADFDGDRMSDVLWRNGSTGEVYVLSFASRDAPYVGAFLLTEPDAAWKIVDAPDINGDGKADLLWWNSSTGQVYVEVVNGFQAIVPGLFWITAEGNAYVEPDTTWRIEAVGDFKGTGKQNQILSRNPATGDVYVTTVTLTAGGSPSQTRQFLFPSNPPFSIVAAADFDGDGRWDILWRDDTTGRVYMMLMNGFTIASQGLIYQEPNLAWKIAAVGDYNGDGKADILWRNGSTGEVYLMLMNGLTIGAQGFIYQEPNTDWKVMGVGEYRIP